MTTAHDVALELRKLADALDKEPEANLPQPMISFYCESKSEFVNTVATMPRPLKKSIGGVSEYPNLEMQHKTDTVWIRAIVPQSLTCTLVEPAKPAVYKCDPILSLEEEAEIEAAHA